MVEKIEFTQKPPKGGVWDVAIIGSGPSALTAAIYTTRGAASTIILGGESWGGQLKFTTVVDNFPGFHEGVQGPELMDRMRAQTERFGAEFIERSVTKVNFLKKPFEVFYADEVVKSNAVILATGAVNKWLEVPGEQEFLGRGVATCAPCDAPFYKDKVVAVIGGGDSALTEALVLTKYAKKVYIIHRRDQLRASFAMQEKARKNQKIEFVWNTEVIEILGSNVVEKLKVKNNKTYQESEILVDGVFIAIGHKPASDIFIGQIDIDDHGYVAVHDNTKTSVDGVFAAGEVHDNRYKQAITSAGFGCMAAMDALLYLDKEISTW